MERYVERLERDDVSISANSRVAIRRVTEALCCGLCAGLFESPVSLTCCQAVFCSACIRAAMTHRSTCPACRAAVPAVDRFLVRAPQLAEAASAAALLPSTLLPCTGAESAPDGEPVRVHSASSMRIVDASELPSRLRRPQYGRLKLAQLRRLLRDCGLSTAGDEAALKRRHGRYVDLFNASIDGSVAPAGHAIAMRVEQEELMRQSDRDLIDSFDALGGSRLLEPAAKPQATTAGASAELAAPASKASAAASRGASATTVTADCISVVRRGRFDVHIHMPAELAELLKTAPEPAAVLIARARLQSIELAAAVASRDWARRKKQLRGAITAPPSADAAACPASSGAAAAVLSVAGPRSGLTGRRLSSVLSPQAEADGWRALWSHIAGRPFFINTRTKTGQWDSPDDCRKQHRATASAVSSSSRSCTGTSPITSSQSNARNGRHNDDGSTTPAGGTSPSPPVQALPTAPATVPAATTDGAARLPASSHAAIGGRSSKPADRCRPKRARPGASMPGVRPGVSQVEAKGAERQEVEPEGAERQEVELEEAERQEVGAEGAERQEVGAEPALRSHSEGSGGRASSSQTSDASVGKGGVWVCSACTYRHDTAEEQRESKCVMCGSSRGPGVRTRRAKKGRGGSRW